MIDPTIQSAFLEAVNEVFSVMFTDQIVFSFLDEEATQTNLYDEVISKEYKDPTYLVGNVKTSFTQGESPIESVQIDAVISIPTKQLMGKSISFSTKSDLEKLARGKIEYGGFEYQIHRVAPRTFIADKWHVYDFLCYVDKTRSID